MIKNKEMIKNEWVIVECQMCVYGPTISIFKLYQPIHDELHHHGYTVYIESYVKLTTCLIK